MKKLKYLLKITNSSQLLTLFLLGSVSSVTITYTSTLLQAKNLNNSNLDTPVRVQSQMSAANSEANVRDINTIDTSIKTAQVNSRSSFTNIRWSTVAPSPIGRSEAQGAVVDGKLYVFGGNVLRADVYNPNTNTWQSIADLPKRITHAGTAVVGRNIYLAGGYVNKPGGGVIFAIPDVWRYNIDSNKWFNDTPQLPEARGSGGLEVLNGKLHFFAGSDIKRADKRDHWVLSLNGGTRWMLAAPLPQARNHMGDAVLDGKLYAIGGQITQDHHGAQYFVDRWEPATNTWRSVARLPRARSHTAAATFVMNNRIIVAGGIATNGASVRDVTAYEPLANKWTELTPLPTTGAFAGGQSSGVAGSIGGKIFYTTGRGFQKTTYKGEPVLVSP